MGETAEPGQISKEVELQAQPAWPRTWHGRLGLWALWVAATAVGFAIIRVSSVTLGNCFLWIDWVKPSDPIDLVRWGCTVGRVLGEGLGGAVMGLGQWLALRRGVRRAGWWILLTALAWPAAFWVNQHLWGLFGSPMNWGLMDAAVVGAVVGLFQRPVLLHQVRWSWAWVLGMIAGLCLAYHQIPGGWAWWITQWSPSPQDILWVFSPVSQSLVGAMWGIVLGAVSGAVLVLLMALGKLGREQ
jgi:hypothetical protein